MSTFQEIIQFFNDTHVRNAIHENVCLIFYGTDLNKYSREGTRGRDWIGKNRYNTEL